MVALDASVDGDDDLDLALASFLTNSLITLENDGFGGFFDLQFFPAGQVVSDVSVGDLDGDGAADVALTAFGSDELVIGISAASEKAAIVLPVGTLCVQLPFTRLLPRQLTSPAGDVSVAVPIALDMVGTTRWYQWWYRDPINPSGTGAALSDGLEVTFFVRAPARERASLSGVQSRLASSWTRSCASRHDRNHVSIRIRRTGRSQKPGPIEANLGAASVLSSLSA